MMFWEKIKMTELKLCIDEKFYEEEERDGYVVDKKAKQIWAVELDLLNELLNVCKKYEIEVYAFAGTLLGAVRHKGFIPWDDDVDVCMTRENFERLLNIADKEFQYPYFLQTALNDRKFFLGYARLRNSETTGVIQWNRSPEYNNGIYIDIFVLDGYIESKIKYKVQMVRKEIIGFILRTYYSKTMPKPFLKKAVFLLACRIFPKMIPYEWAVKRYNFILSL